MWLLCHQVREHLAQQGKDAGRCGQPHSQSSIFIIQIGNPKSHITNFTYMCYSLKTLLHGFLQCGANDSVMDVFVVAIRTRAWSLFDSRTHVLLEMSAAKELYSTFWHRTE